MDNRTKHGMHHHRLYRTYYNMISRCYNENNASYKRYGGRGITVCEEWRMDIDHNNIYNFIKWSEFSHWEEGLTLDRIDNDGNYYPENCRWITPKQSARNRSSNNYVTYEGKTLTVAEWADDPRCTVKTRTLYSRVVICKWDMLEAFTVPVYSIREIHTYDGETKTLKEWAKDDRCKVPYITLRYRIKNRWNFQDAITLPLINEKNTQ